MTVDFKLSDDQNWLPSKRPHYIFGPCSAESQNQLLETAAGIKANFDDIIFRAGVWKPRTRPNSFEGVGKEGLQWLVEVKEQFGFKVATEVANADHVEACLKAGIDVLWIGARTTVNPFSVQAIADALKGQNIPVFVKNPIHPDLSLWIGALERINKAGINQIGAIHRGFFLSDNGPYRNSPNWSLAVQLKTEFPDIPLICDASHISGTPTLIPAVSQRAMDLDMDGLLIETHIHPADALSDANQQLTPSALNDIISKLVFKTQSVPNDEFKDKLQLLREEIDQVDTALLEALAARMAVVRKIGKYKKENNVTILQMERWQQILKKCLQEGVSLGLSDNFVRDLLNAIHDESIKQQTNS